MPVQFGRNAFISVLEETTYGTLASGSYTDMRLVSCSLGKTIERARKTHLNHGTAGFVRSTFDAFNVTGGNISGPLHYAGNGAILLAALGQVNSSAGPAPRTHTFTPLKNLPSLSIKFHRGDAQSGNKTREDFKGCVVNTLTISCAAGEEAQFSAEIIAQDADARALDANTASFPASATSVLHHQSSDLTFNTGGSVTTYKVRSFEIVIDNKIERRNLLGSQLTSEPNTSDVREVRMTVTTDLEDNQMYNDFITTPAAVDADAILTMTGTGHDTMRFTIFNAVIEEYSDAVTTFGRIERTFTLLGTVDGSGNEAIKIEMINGNASPI
tara:strand:- start:947 stop:1927 length:981 start_codon:yes stop_codon:yes gene_type:complete